MNSKKLRAEIDKVNASIADLQPQLELATAKSNAAESSFVRATVTLEELQATKAAEMSLRDTIDSLLRSASKLQGQLIDAEKSEARNAVFSELAEKVKDAKAEAERVGTLRRDFASAAAHLMEAQVSIAKQQMAFGDIIRRELPGLERFNSESVPKRLRIAYRELMVELAAAGIPYTDVEFMAKAVEYPKTDFDAAITAAERSYEARYYQAMEIERDRQRQERIDAAAVITRQAEERRRLEKQEALARQNRGLRVWAAR